MARRQKEQNKKQNITEEKEKQKPVRSKLFLVAGLILFFLIAGIAGFLYFGHNEKDKITDVKKEKESAFAGEKKEKGEEAFSLPSIVVNLAGSSEHYVRVTCVLVFSKNDKKLAQELEEKNYVLCDTLIKTLRGKKVEEIQKDPAANKLKNDLQQAINKQLNSGNITGIYFTELLVQ